MDLTLHLKSLDNGREREVRRTLELEDWAEMVEGYDTYSAAGPLDVLLVARKLDGGVIVEGRLKAPLKAECGRCVMDFPTELDVEVRTIYQPAPAGVSSEEELELTEEDLEFSFYIGDAIDLLDFVRESLILELPSHPSCELKADGTCPVHGHDPQRVLVDSEDDAPIEDWKRRLLDIKKKLD